VIKTGEKNIRH